MTTESSDREGEYNVRDSGEVMSGHCALTRDGTLTGKTVETVKQKEFIVESRCAESYRAETPRAESTPP